MEHYLLKMQAIYFMLHIPPVQNRKKIKKV